MRPRQLIQRRSLRTAAQVVCLVVTAARPAAGQEASGTAWTTTAGGALGLYTGVLLGTVGALTPCTQTWSGPGCVRWSALAAGAVGLASGLAVGTNDRDRVGAAATGAGIGFAVGVAAGAALKPIVQRFSWADVATAGLVGGAIGTAPTGAAIGLVTGGAVGAVLRHRIGVPNAIAVALGGLALGGVAEWVVRAGQGTPDAQAQLRVVLPLAVRF